MQKGRQINEYIVRFWAKTDDGKQAIRKAEEYVRNRLATRGDVVRLLHLIPIGDQFLVCLHITSYLEIDKLHCVLPLGVQPYTTKEARPNFGFTGTETKSK